MKEEKDKLIFLKTDYKSVFIQIIKELPLGGFFLIGVVKWN